MKKIKVAINDSTLVKQLRNVLTPMKYEIEISELNQHFADADFSETDLIILDPHLGDIGIAEGLIDTLKSRSSTSRIPILLCTHQEDDASLIEGLSAGANDFILLPITTRTLQSRLKTLMRR